MNIRITTYKILAFLSFLLLAICSHAQKLSDMPAGRLKNLATSALMYQDPHSAIEYYEAYLKKKKDNAKIMYALAECYRQIRDYDNALKWYKKAFKADEQNLMAQYYWASMLMTKKQYQEAYELFKEFKKNSSDDKSIGEYSKLCRNLMAGCRTAMKDSGNVVWMVHADSSLNFPSAELSPLFLDENTLLFSSLRTNQTVYNVSVDSLSAIPVRKFYLANKNDGSFTFTSEWDNAPFNLEGMNTGNGALSPDGKRFYFTRCMKNWKNETICTIYQSEQDENGVWSDPKALPASINNPKYTSTHPAVGTFSKRDDEILYFVSNRPGGKGGLDIWFSRYDEKKNLWKAPKNCGSKINTAGDEVTPFVDMENRAMYFSSNGWEGWGELDVYRTIGELSKWMPNENVKPPINSPYDDLYYTLNEYLTDGFVVSNRPSPNNRVHPTCCDDLYQFKYDEVIRVKASGSVYAKIDNRFKQMFSGKFESNDETLVDSSFKMAEGVVATLYIIDETAPMGSGNMVYIKNDTLDENGHYSFNLDAGKEYVIEIENYGYLNRMLNISTFFFKESGVLEIDTIGIDIMPKEPLVIKNIYYEFGKAELSKKAKRILDSTLLTLMMENQQIVIEISSHTDNKGRSKLNKELSQKRAEAVRKYLMKKGVDKSRLYAKGYGEERPVAPNETPDGKDNPDGREKNRRTEFKIIGSLDQYSGVLYQE